MPIDVKTLETEGREVTAQKNRPAQETVLGFLRKKENKGQAFMQKEIADEVGMKPQQVRQIMHALMKKNVVTRKTCSYTNDAGKSEDGIFWKLV